MIEDLKIHVSSEETQTKIELSGELDDFSAAQFHGFFDAYQFSDAMRTLCVDLSGLSFLDSVGLGVLITFVREKKDVEVLLHAPQSQVHRLLAQSGLIGRGYFELTGLTEPV
jgi:anti-anti-sigma factor